MSKYREYLENKGFAVSTVRCYEKYTNDFLVWAAERNLEAEIIHYNQLLQFINHCKSDNRKPKTINQILTAIRHYYQANQINNPAAGLYLKGGIDPIPNDLLTKEELNTLYESYEVYNHRTQRNKVIIGLYVYQGITTEELKQLEPGHIKLTEGEIHVPGTKKTKQKGGRKSRVLKLKANQILSLQDYLLITRPKIIAEITQIKSGRKPNEIKEERLKETLFMSLNGSAEIKPSIKFLMADLRVMNPALKDSRQLRRSVIVNWLKKNDIRTVQYMAGHGSINSTERYQAANMEELGKALKMYHPLA